MTAAPAPTSNEASEDEDEDEYDPRFPDCEGAASFIWMIAPPDTAAAAAATVATVAGDAAASGFPDGDLPRPVESNELVEVEGRVPSDPSDDNEAVGKGVDEATGTGSEAGAKDDDDDDDDDEDEDEVLVEAIVRLLEDRGDE